MDDFVEKFYDIDSRQNQVDYLYDYIDRLYCNGQFDVALDFLESVDLTRVNTSIIRSLCLMAWWGRDNIPEDRRLALTHRAYDRVVTVNGQDVADRVIKKAFLDE